jgi:hypothetical protein
MSLYSRTMTLSEFSLKIKNTFAMFRVEAEPGSPATFRLRATRSSYVKQSTTSRPGEERTTFIIVFASFFCVSPIDILK